MARLQISDKLLYLDRSEWDNSGAPRQTISVDPLDREYEIMHHVVATDDDSTPNLWENLDEVITRMRGLRTARPDLGGPVDNPYTWTGFFMASSFMGEGGLVVCEGRGHLYRGAHTKYHNRTGVGLAIYGDFENYLFNMSPFAPQLSRFWSWAKYEIPLPNLGNARPPTGAEGWFHRQLNEKNGLGYTACAGQHLNSKIHLISTTDPNPPQEDDMTTHKLYNTWNPAALWIIEFVASVPMWRRWIITPEGASQLISKLGKPENTTEANLATVPVIGVRP